MNTDFEKLLCVKPSQTRTILVASGKGGVGKTLSAYSIAHGIGLSVGSPDVATVVQTDIHRNQYQSAGKVGGRMFTIFSGQDAGAFERVEAAIQEGSPDQVVIIDSAGTAGQSRQAFDETVARSVDLVLIPVTNDREAIDEALKKYEAIERVRDEQGLLDPILFVNNLPPNLHHIRREMTEIRRAVRGKVLLRRPFKRSDTLGNLKRENFGEVAKDHEGQPLLSSKGTELRYILSRDAEAQVRGFAEAILKLFAVANPNLGREYDKAAAAVLKQLITIDLDDRELPMRATNSELRQAATVIAA